VVAAAVLALVAVKAAVLYAIGRRALGTRSDASDLAVAISQGGEFAFVLFQLAVGYRLMDAATSELLVVVVTLSMAVTPVLHAVHRRVLRPRLQARSTREFDRVTDTESAVLIAGFGRVGQVVCRVLRAKGVAFTALDVSSEHIDFIRRFGNKVFYGDASRLDLLRAAGAEKARVFVLAIDDVEASLRTAETVRRHFPHLVLFARARNRGHAYRLLDLGVTRILRETFAGSLELTGDVLEALGVPFSETRRALERFREHDERLLRDSHAHSKDLGKLQELAVQSREELQRIFESDAKDSKAA
jgi:glutathione-regulated potassium-efflux system ancillary protein KefC